MGLAKKCFLAKALRRKRFTYSNAYITPGAFMLYMQGLLTYYIKVFFCITIKKVISIRR